MNMKTCKTCAREKPENEFNWKKIDRWRKTECIACAKLRGRRNYANRRDGLTVVSVTLDVSPLVRCSRCREPKSRTAFSKNASRPNGLNNQCTDCRKDGYARSAPRLLEERRQLYASDAAHRAKLAADRRKYNTGATAPEYEMMCSEQDNKCYLCKQTCTSGKALAMDHDHATGLLRRPLCGRCNLTLGKVKDDVTLLRRMAAYVEFFSGAIVDFAGQTADITEAS